MTNETALTLHKTDNRLHERKRHVTVRIIGEPGENIAEAVARYLIQRELARPKLESVRLTAP